MKIPWYVLTGISALMAFAFIFDAIFMVDSWAKKGDDVRYLGFLIAFLWLIIGYLLYDGRESKVVS